MFSFNWDKGSGQAHVSDVIPASNIWHTQTGKLEESLLKELL